MVSILERDWVSALRPSEHRDVARWLSPSRTVAFLRSVSAALVCPPRGAACLMLAMCPWIGSAACAAAAVSVAPLSKSTERGQSPRDDEPASAERAEDEEATVRVELLDNGDFAQANLEAIDYDGVRRLPWWRSTRGMEQRIALDSVLRPTEDPTRASSWAARTRGKEQINQPLAAFAPLARTLVIRGHVRGTGRVVVVDGTGQRVPFDLPVAETWSAFEVRGEDLEERLGRPPMPRFELRLEAGGEDHEALWRGLSASVELPCPSERALRAELLATLRGIFSEYFERGLDDVGPRATGFFCHEFDAITGAVHNTFPATGFIPGLFDTLRMAVEVEDEPQWRAGFDRFVGDLLSLGLHPRTGLPRLWNPVTDEPLDEKPVEFALTLGFLIDVARSGPERWRAPARAAAVRIGETVLATGVVPDGTIAASCVPSTGEINMNVGRLRRFDVLAQLARLSELTDDRRYVNASRESLAAFELTHLWSGTWQQIDPAFDDEFGHYGARAATSWRVCPEEPAFRRYALGGWTHFEGLWRNAVRLGGTCAADQVRCWVLLLDVAQLEPGVRAPIRAALWDAARNHFKGEQDGGGAWQDLTVIDFDPQMTMADAVGDVNGPPQNLLHGLAAIYDESIGLRNDTLRAMYTTVLRSSVAAYQRKHGFQTGRKEHAGKNSALGSLKLALGLAKMFRKLPR